MQVSRVKWIQQLDGSSQVLRLERTTQEEDYCFHQMQFLLWKEVPHTTLAQYQAWEFSLTELEPISMITRTLELLQSVDCPLP